MLRSIVLLATVALTGIPLLPHASAESQGQPHAAAEPRRQSDAADLIPVGAALALTVRDGDRRLQDFRRFQQRNGRVSQTLRDLIATNPGFAPARVGLLGLAGAADLDPWEAIASLLGRDLTIALVPRDDAEPALIAASSLRDADTADRFLGSIRAATGLESGGVPDPDRSFEHAGEIVFHLGEGFMCRTGEHFVFANDRALMTLALDIGAGKADSLLAGEAFREGRAAVPAAAVASLYVSPEFLRSATLEAGIEDMISNPLAGLVLGGWHHGVRNLDTLSLWLDAEDRGLTLRLAATTPEPLPGTHRGFLPDPGAMPRFRASELDGSLGEIRVHRDWAALFAERESLLTLTAAGQLVEFSNNVTTLAAGLDFIDDVLDNVNGPVRLLAAAQSFEGRDVTPAVRLPAFALVAPVEVNERMQFPARVNAAALSAFSIINFERSQNGQSPMLPNLAQVDGSQAVYARFAPIPLPDEAADPDAMGAPPLGGIEHNFEPAVAVLNDRLVIATSLDLLRDVAGRLQEANGGPGPAAQPDTLLIDGRRLAALLAQNRDELIANRMVGENLSRQRAARDIDAILALVALVDDLALNASIEGRTYEADLNLTLDTAPLAEGE